MLDPDWMLKSHRKRNMFGLFLPPALKSQCCPAPSANTNISFVLYLLLDFFNWTTDLWTINKHWSQLTAKWSMKGKFLLQPRYSNIALSRQNPLWNVNASLPSSFHLFHQLGGLCGPIHHSFHSLSILHKQALPLGGWERNWGIRAL